MRWKGNGQKEAEVVFLETMAERAVLHLETKLGNPANKIDPLLATGFVTMLLHTVSSGVAVSPPTIEKLTQLEQNIDNYDLSEVNKAVLKEALAWLLRQK